MALESKELIYTLNWLAVAEGCRLIVLDHLTMVTYDMQGEQSERKDIDVLMKALRQLTYKTGCSILLISHLKRPNFGKSWAEGREVQMTDARGSAAIEQLSDYMLALERNTIDEVEKLKTKTKVMKNRVTGQTGYADEIYYQEKTGRMITLDELFK
jgi:twinkle protein